MSSEKEAYHPRTAIVMTTQTLVLEELDERHPGLTKGIAASYAEAARVCLDRHHNAPVAFAIDRAENPCTAVISWQPVDARIRNAWANATDATEAGAYCIALAAIEITDGLVAISRAEILTGADYYIGIASEGLQDLEKSRRLEVSGIDQGDLAALKSRLAQKVRQCHRGESSLPAIATVVGFSAATVLTSDVELG